MDYPIAILGLSALVIGAVGLKCYANGARTELNWPRNMAFFAMRRRVRSFFKGTGWQVRPHILPEEKLSPIEYDFVVSRRSPEFLVKCYPSGMGSFATALKDFSTLKHGVYYKRVGFIFLTAEKVPRGIALAALNDGVFVLHYKMLRELSSLDTISTDSLRTLVVGPE